MRSTKAWSSEELTTLRRDFPNMATRDLARKMGRSQPSLNGMARILGITKSRDRMAPILDEAGKSGVYAIVDPAGDMYVGSTVDMLQRWHVHRYQLRKGYHHSHSLQAVWNNCGDAGLSFKVLEYCDKDSLHATEQRFFGELNPRHNIYVTAGSAAGMKLSDAHKRKLSDHLKGRIITAEERVKRSNAQKGRVLSEEHKRKISLSRKDCKSVRCRETGDVFRTTVDATRWIQERGRPTASNSPIIKVCKGVAATAYGYTWEYVEGQEAE